MELNEKQQQVFDIIIDCIIPASPERSMPAASEVGVWAFIVRLANDEAATIAKGVDWLDAESAAWLGESITRAEHARVVACMAHLRELHPGCLDRLARLTMSCYYQHDAVLRGIGMEPRPPFPLGHTVAAGDLTLLDPVRQRGPIFRSV